jgi:hypothetical protein
LKIDIWKLFLENILPQGTLSKAELNVAKPKWLKVKLPIGQKYTELRGLVDKYNLNDLHLRKLPKHGRMLGRRNHNLYDIRKCVYVLVDFAV